MKKYGVLGFFSLLIACGDISKPIEASTRRKIDSIATAEIQKIRLKTDSFYQEARKTTMSQVIDSIKQVRLREIDEQLKSIPIK
jgi:hypothetical protein